MASVCEEFHQKLSEILDPLGFECYPFKIGWYNEKVGSSFRLDIPDDTLAFVVISTPIMFDKAFKPYVWRQNCTGPEDHIDKCMRHYFSVIRELFPNLSIECIHDYEMHHSRRPKILVQTAGHVAGAVYYYQRSDVKNDPWSPERKIHGVCVHPKYGGWFALRGVIIFRDILVPFLEQKTPPDVLPDEMRRIELLEKFNFHYEDWKYRDIIDPVDRYSEQQKKYFFTPPGKREELVKEIIAEEPQVDVSS